MAVEFFIDSNLCSINQKFFIMRGRNILSTKYRQVKAYLIGYFGLHDKEELPDPPYKITVQSSQYEDIDANLKIMLDALECAGVIENDRMVHSLKILKTPIKRGGEQSHYIRVDHYDKQEHII